LAERYLLRERTDHDIAPPSANPKQHGDVLPHFREQCWLGFGMLLSERFSKSIDWDIARRRELVRPSVRSACNEPPTKTAF
jgi:hypothetical protein